MISHISLNIEIMAGSSITEAAENMLKLSRHLDMMICGNFNTVHLIVLPHYTVKQIEEDYEIVHRRLIIAAKMEAELDVAS